jgi:hypothetical protein
VRPGVYLVAEQTIRNRDHVGHGSNRQRGARVRAGAGEPTSDSRLHAVAYEGMPFRDIAAAIGRGTGVPTASIAAEPGEPALGTLLGCCAPAEVVAAVMSGDEPRIASAPH